MDETAPAGYNDGTWDDPVEVIADLRTDIARIRDRIEEFAAICTTVGIREAGGCLDGALVLLHVAEGRLS